MKLLADLLLVLADLLLVLGAGFLFLGALGLWRMPDPYTRIQAGTKAVTLGSIAFLFGLWLHQPGWWPKLLLIILFILLTSPIAASTLARAAERSGLRPWLAPQDRQAESQPAEKEVSP